MDHNPLRHLHQLKCLIVLLPDNVFNGDQINWNDEGLLYRRSTLQKLESLPFPIIFRSSLTSSNDLLMINPDEICYENERWLLPQLPDLPIY